MMLCTGNWLSVANSGPDRWVTITVAPRLLTVSAGAPGDGGAGDGGHSKRSRYAENGEVAPRPTEIAGGRCRFLVISAFW
jgi:hypothetical protein